MSRPTTLQAAQREVPGSAASRRLRREGIIPAVIYGAQQRTYPIQVNNKDFAEILRHQTSENFLVNLEIEGAKEKTKLAIVQEIQQNPMTGQVIHVDFHAVKEDENVHANVPIELTGDAVGVKIGGLLEHLVHSLDIECLPANLPDMISHDVSDLAIGESVHVRDLALPTGVATHMDGDVVVALIAESRVAVSAGAGEEGGAADAKAEGGADES